MADYLTLHKTTGIQYPFEEYITFTSQEITHKSGGLPPVTFDWTKVFKVVELDAVITPPDTTTLSVSDRLQAVVVGGDPAVGTTAYAALKYDVLQNNTALGVTTTAPVSDVVNAGNNCVGLALPPDASTLTIDDSIQLKGGQMPLGGLTCVQTQALAINTIAMDGNNMTFGTCGTTNSGAIGAGLMNVFVGSNLRPNGTYRTTLRISANTTLSGYNGTGSWTGCLVGNANDLVLIAPTNAMIQVEHIQTTAVAFQTILKFWEIK